MINVKEFKKRQDQLFRRLREVQEKQRELLEREHVIRTELQRIQNKFDALEITK